MLLRLSSNSPSVIEIEIGSSTSRAWKSASENDALLRAPRQRSIASSTDDLPASPGPHETIHARRRLPFDSLETAKITDIDVADTSQGYFPVENCDATHNIPSCQALARRKRSSGGSFVKPVDASHRYQGRRPCFRLTQLCLNQQSLLVVLVICCS
jgi:hypothetical protein